MRADVADVVGVGYFLVGRNVLFLMKKMVPVLVMRSEGRRFFPMPNSKRRSHSLAFDISQVEASGPWSRFVREA